MKHEIDLKGYKVRTDLLSEILDRELKDYKRDIKSFDDIKVETIELDKESAEVIMFASQRLTMVPTSRQ